MNGLPHLLKSELARPDHVAGSALCVDDVLKLTAFERKRSRLNLVVALIEVRVLLVFREVCDQELATVASLSSAEALDSTRALATVAHLEESTI